MKSASKDDVLKWGRYTAICPECKETTHVSWENLIKEIAKCAYCYKLFKIED